MPSVLDELINRVQELPEDQKHAAYKLAAEVTGSMKWVPNPGPQTEAYLSQADILLYGGQAGGGKALCIHTPIATTYGWSTMGELAVGDAVFGADGRPCRVIAKSDVFSEDTYRIGFSDGSEIVAGARHEWVTSTWFERDRELRQTEQWRAKRRAARPSRTKGNKSPAFVAAITASNSARANIRVAPLLGVRTTREIYETLRTEDGRTNHSIVAGSPLILPDAPLLIDPYVLGAWLGDGSSTQGVVSGIDEEIFEQIGQHYLVRPHNNPYTRGVLGLVGQLRQLGVYGNKHIPPAYLRSSSSQRLALLQGLMDTDGHCNDRGQCEIQLVRKALIDDAMELVCSLGIKAQMREGVAKLYGRTIGPKWGIKFITEQPAFRLPRKLIRQKRAGFRGTHDVRYIIAVENVDPVPLQCIQVDNPDQMYLCGRAMIPTHNSNLLIGWGVNESQTGIIFRRQLSQTDGLERDGKQMIGNSANFNGTDLEWTWPE